MKTLKIFIIPILVAELSNGMANADFIFSEPSKVPNVNTSSYDDCGSISSDGLELYITSFHPYGANGCYGDIYIATRPTIYDDWGTPTKLEPPVNSDGPEGSPCISDDGLELYFDEGWSPTLLSGCTRRPGGYGESDIWVSTRLTRDDTWGEPQNIGPDINISDKGGELESSISPDGLSLYFTSYRESGYGLHDIYVAKRPTKDDPWGPPENLGPLFNTSTSERSAFVSPDNLSLYFSRSRSGVSDYDIYVSRRINATNPWEAPVPFEPINSSMSEYNLKFAPGCSEIYFNRINTPGTVETMATVDIWQVEVTPIVDFNGDGMVDAEDVSIIVEYWLTPEPLYDIGPLPLGDGLVDSQDLIVLADHLFEEVNDPTLVAHWPLDEQEGNIAYNSVSGCDGHLMGSPTWQPSVGIVAGALEFDGIDDYVMTEPFLNPVDAVFSVAIWVKGGAPGQAILSQVYGVNWLCTDSVYGNLMTELRDTARGKSLSSQTSITDNSWHRVGFVWDGSYRHLYVDGAEVATDIAPLSSLKDAEGGLYFGVSSTLAPKTFFSGLIDDVRIYNRVIIP